MITIIDEIRALALAKPDQPAMVIDGEHEVTMTYAELIQRVDNFASKLIRSELEPGSRVGLLAAQGSGFVIAGLGILAAGHCFVPISDDYQGQALEQFCQRTQLHGLLREASGFNLELFTDPGFVDGQEDREFHNLKPAYIRFTSGTTNERKGVIIGHEAILARLTNANQALQINSEDKIMWMLPMAHHFVVSILLYLRYGATILIPRGFLSQQVLSFSNKAKATVFYASPYHYDLLAKDTSNDKLPSVRLAISTASGLSEDIALRFLTRMGFPLTQALGVIEVGLSVMNIKRAREKPLSLGQVLPAYHIWLRGDGGQPLEAKAGNEEYGEIHIQGTGLFDAYMSPWKLARDIVEPDGFCTGDLGYFDQDGDLVIKGRRNNRINMAGMKFFVEEVEAVINTHPAIKESRVYGKPHARVGEIPMADIVLEDGHSTIDIRELSDYCRDRLAAHKIPFLFEPVPQLEYTVTGKIKRW